MLVPHATDYKIFGNSSVMANTVTFEDTVLQTLNRRVGDRRLIFPLDEFEMSLSKWNGIPAYFSPTGKHPTNFDYIRQNEIDAGVAEGCKLIGHIVNPHIEVEGHPRLMSSVDILDGNDNVIQLWKEGKLSLSTAFTAQDDGDKITSPPEPNHVLFFEEIVDKVLPGDPGAFVNTSEVSTMPDEEKKSSIYERLMQKITQVFKDDEKSLNSEDVSEDTVNACKDDDEEKKKMVDEIDIESLQKELADKTAEVEELKAEIVALKKLIEDNGAETGALKEVVETMKAELNSYHEQEKESKFQSFLQTLPEGKKATEEMVSELRKKFESDPVSLLMNTLTDVKNHDSGETKKVGEVFTNSVVEETDSDNWNRWNKRN